MNIWYKHILAILCKISDLNFLVNDGEAELLKYMELKIFKSFVKSILPAL